MSLQSAAGRARLYVSFADEDRARVMELVRWLNDSGWRVQADLRHAFAANGDWDRDIADRLEACDVVICVITPGWLISKFCHYEYSYCAKRGKFVLPVICELADFALLPEAMRALPRVDLRRNRVIDYLALKEVLTQAGSRIGHITAEPQATAAQNPTARRWIVLLLAAAAALGVLALAWIWIRAVYSSL